MLIFLNYYLCPGGEVVLNQETKECYLYIYKNGTRSLHQLLDIDSKYVHYNGNELTDFLNQYGVNELTVFLREPIDRIISAIYTQSQMYKMPINVFEEFINSDNICLPIQDQHTIPQFWYLLRASENNSNLKFNIKPLSEINKINNIGHLNAHPKDKIKNLNLNNRALNKLDFLYTEDVVLFNQFLNTTTTVNEIIEKIKLEKSFIDTVKEYQHQLTYLL